MVKKTLWQLNRGSIAIQWHLTPRSFAPPGRSTITVSKTLQLSVRMQQRICGMWCSIEDDQQAWFEIEEQAMALLSKYHARKASMLQLPLLIALLPKYMQPEQSLVDNAVLTAALNIRGRPAFGPVDLEDTLAPPSDTSETDLLAELDIATTGCPAIPFTGLGGPRVLEHGPFAVPPETELGHERLAFDRFNFIDFEESQDLEPMTFTSLNIWELEMPTSHGSDNTTRPVTRFRPLRR